MILKEFTPEIYPRKIWLVIPQKQKDYNAIVDRFTAYNFAVSKNTKLAQDKFLERIRIGRSAVLAECWPVEEKESTDYGILCIIHEPPNMDASHFAHESVHIADYICEQLGLLTQDFTEGNEAYAYLVGYIMTCFMDIIEQYNKTVK